MAPIGRVFILWQKWLRKFQTAARGVVFGVAEQDSFLVHIPVAVLVILAAAILQCAAWQWCVLLLCIGVVMSAELANSAIEELAAGLCRERNPKVGRALDIAAGAVLVASVSAALVGAVVFIYQFQR